MIAQDVNSALEQVLAKMPDNVVTTDTRRDSFNFYKKGLFLQHAYTVTGVKEEDGIFYIIVRNPYANRSRRYKKDSTTKETDKM